MFKCTVEGCEGTAKTLSGLSSHVKSRHPDLDWEETKKEMQQTVPKEPQRKYEMIPFDPLTEDMVKRIAKGVVNMMQNVVEPQTEKLLPQGLQSAPIEED